VDPNPLSVRPSAQVDHGGQTVRIQIPSTRVPRVEHCDDALKRPLERGELGGNIGWGNAFATADPHARRLEAGSPRKRPTYFRADSPGR
jgi:hypothetical protein